MGWVRKFQWPQTLYQVQVQGEFYPDTIRSQIVELLFGSRSHPIEGLANGPLAIVSTPLGQLSSLKPWELIHPWSRHFWLGWVATNLPLWMWHLKGEGQRKALLKSQAAWCRHQANIQVAEIPEGRKADFWPWLKTMTLGKSLILWCVCVGGWGVVFPSITQGLSGCFPKAFLTLPRADYSGRGAAWIWLAVIYLGDSQREESSKNLETTE
jgi:hypothetical protein